MRKVKIRHRVERTRNRHSRAVFKDEMIIIRLAKNLSQTEEREHIQDLLRSMTRQILEDKKRTLIDPFRALLTGASRSTVTLANGKKYVIQLVPGTRNKAERKKDGWVISVAPGTKRKGLHRMLWNLIAEAEIDRVMRLIDEVNDETFRERFHTLRFSIATSQWGSCSSRGVIMLNAALLFVPESALRYVIAHELAHFRVGDHSHRYWNHLAQNMPHYKRGMNLLKRFRLPNMH